MQVEVQDEKPHIPHVRNIGCVCAAHTVTSGLSGSGVQYRILQAAGVHASGVYYRWCPLVRSGLQGVRVPYELRVSSCYQTVQNSSLKGYALPLAHELQ